MDTQQLVVMISRDKLVRGAVFDKSYERDPVVKHRLQMYSDLADRSGVSMDDVLQLVPHMLTRASFRRLQKGGVDDSDIGFTDILAMTKGVIMDGITVTMRSILDRTFDKSRIDDNLREGAANRKKYVTKFKDTYLEMRKTHPTMPKNQLMTRVDAIVTKEMQEEAVRKTITDTKYTVTEVPLASGKQEEQTIITTDKPLTVSGTKNYHAATNLINAQTPDTALDKQISIPLSEAPVGKTGASIVIASNP